LSSIIFHGDSQPESEQKADELLRFLISTCVQLHAHFREPYERAAHLRGEGRQPVYFSAGYDAIGMTSLSWDRFPDCHRNCAIDAEVLDVAERAAAPMEDDDIIATVKAALDDEPIEPAAKRPAVAEAAAAVDGPSSYCE
jgi:hypothetical protein